MTCAQGLLRLLWGGPEVGVLRDCTFKGKIFESVVGLGVMLDSGTVSTTEKLGMELEMFKQKILRICLVVVEKIVKIKILKLCLKSSKLF